MHVSLLEKLTPDFVSDKRICILNSSLKLNVVKDNETEANRPPPEPVKKQVRIRREPIPIPTCERSTRVRKPNSVLSDYVETNVDGEVLRELGRGLRGFVVIGGNKHFL